MIRDIRLISLKQINDTLGHLEGDHAFVEAAEILKRTYRESDIVARLGGDEFVVLAPGTIQKSLVTRLKNQLKLHYEADNHSSQLAMSVGIVRFDPK